jgi:hypothetical protein
MPAICRTSDPHSATQGSFDDPCVYLNDTEGAGFDSGVQSGTKFTIQITNDQERRQTSCRFFPLWCNDFTRQPSGFSARLRATVVSEWLGWHPFELLYSHFLDVVLLMFFFFFRSAINAPTTGDRTFAIYLATVKALGSHAPNVGRSLPPCTYYTFNWMIFRVPSLAQ